MYLPGAWSASLDRLCRDERIKEKREESKCACRVQYHEQGEKVTQDNRGPLKGMVFIMQVA